MSSAFSDVAGAGPSIQRVSGPLDRLARFERRHPVEPHTDDGVPSVRGPAFGPRHAARERDTARRSARIGAWRTYGPVSRSTCLDPDRVARFWSALLGREPGPSEDGWVYLGERDDPQPRLVFQPVPEPRTGKVRIHLDVSVDDIGQASAEVIDLGGRFTGERHDYDQGVVVVMADPEDHEFRLVQYY